jgi:hypothetical protein
MPTAVGYSPPPTHCNALMLNLLRAVALAFEAQHAIDWSDVRQDEADKFSEERLTVEEAGRIIVALAGAVGVLSGVHGDFLTQLLYFWDEPKIIDLAGKLLSVWAIEEGPEHARIVDAIKDAVQMHYNSDSA